MNEQTDQQLLRAYAERHSEAAFATLVQRYIDLVYSAAIRMVCDPHAAKDVTQSVFVVLAQNARQLTDRPTLAGWLHLTARNLAVKTIRSDARRRAREQEAAVMNELLSTHPDAGWEHIAPHLDEALGELNEPERDAVLLRYFKNHDLRTVGATLGISDDAAQKRVSRAVERLREFFAKRGVTVGAGGLAVIISANAVQAAPVGLALTISTAAALTGTTLVTTATVTATKAIAMTALQKTLVTATIAVLAGAGIYEARQASQLRDQVQALQQQQAPLFEQLHQLQTNYEGVTSRLEGSLAENSRLTGNTNQTELLRLRGEATRFRNDSRELSQLKSNQAVAERELLDLGLAQMKQTMTNNALTRVEKIKSRLGLSDVQADAIKTAMFAKADGMAQIYQSARHSGLSPEEQRSQFQKLDEDTNQKILSTMSEDQLAAYQQMLKDEAANFGISWGKSEAAYIDRHSKLSSDQKTEVAKVIAELPDDEGGPTSLALGASNPGAQQKLEARIRALENVLTQEQLEKYRQARMREIEQSSAMMRALGIGESSGR